ncbi:hypothetical protein [Urbifossiella limnaea]|uniref:Uncharacterized protein n=1 Tax=Urbifossiella limnaea TaxID=2528023 RepID=A0A517XWH5_9BACT|nr:hypothetical protein [Urbifossiella limnaea]QDU21848.1 hypothetical protein ETAA1_38210 [Urbifossiella limnaea]
MDEAFATELDAIPWLSNIGQPVTAVMPWPVIPVTSWGEAFACFDDDWEALKGAARDRLTTFMRDRRNRGIRDFDWNEMVRAIKARVLTRLDETVWRPFGERHGLTPVFADLVASDVRLAALEYETRRIAGRPEFFRLLLQVYRAGHFPCGWCAGTWPDGTLVIY